MRLSELSRPSRLVAGDVLANAGYQPMGAGGYGSVYYKEGAPYVLKTFGADDSAYLAYIELCRAHTDNPHFPKFIGKLVKVTPDYFAIRLEKLKRNAQDVDFLFNYMRYRDYCAGPHPEGSHSCMMHDDAYDIMADEPQLIQACDLIIDNLLTNYRLDIKPNNVMYRGSTLVMIDPVCNP